MVSDILQLIKKTRRNSVTFSASGGEDSLGGLSKIGGRPVLPENFKWPYYRGESIFDGEVKNRPLSFIAQFDMSEIAIFDTDNMLPHTGFMYFFYELNTMCWGFSPDDIGCAKVYYFDVEADKLCEYELPDDLDENLRVPEMKLSFGNAESYPVNEEFCDIFEKDIDWEEYDDILAELGVDTGRDPEKIFKLLGYADTIQGSMLIECEKVTSGIYCGSPVKLPQDKEKEIAEKSRDWILLAQFGTISDEIMFGDCGCIYYYIREKDLKNKRFDRVHLILQCC